MQGKESQGGTMLRGIEIMLVLMYAFVLWDLGDIIFRDHK